MKKHNHVGKNAYVSRVYSNIASEIIQITVDKLEIILKDYLESLEKKTSWHTPFALFVSLLLAFATTNFKEAFGLGPSTWCAVFFMVTIVSAIWLLMAWWKSGKVMTISELLVKIKESK